MGERDFVWFQIKASFGGISFIATAPGVQRNHSVCNTRLGVSTQSKSSHEKGQITVTSSSHLQSNFVILSDLHSFRSQLFSPLWAAVKTGKIGQAALVTVAGTTVQIAYHTIEVTTTNLNSCQYIAYTIDSQYIMWHNITHHCTQHNNFEGKALARLWTPQRHPYLPLAGELWAFFVRFFFFFF